MKRIVLFRFHQNTAVCKSRLAEIKHLNPGVAIYGLYGGKPDDPEGIQESLRAEFVSIFSIADKSDSWKWKHSDLAARLWYQEIGQHISFDILHLLEWDLLLCDSLDNCYHHVSQGVGLTGLVPLERVAKWDWLNEEPSKSEWQELLAYVQEKFHYMDSPYACLGPGACFSREFLEKYAAVDVPELCHDELRLPLFCQILQEPMFDTGFYRKWFSPEEKQYFNCTNMPIADSIIISELAKPDGRRVFHPYRQVGNFALGELEDIKKDTPAKESTTTSAI